jgi:hypothetical protein
MGQQSLQDGSDGKHRSAWCQGLPGLGPGEFDMGGLGLGMLGPPALGPWSGTYGSAIKKLTPSEKACLLDCSAPYLLAVTGYLDGGRLDNALQCVLTYGNEQTLRCTMHLLNPSAAWRDMLDPRFREALASHFAHVLVLLVCKAPLSCTALEAARFLDALLEFPQGSQLINEKDKQELYSALLCMSRAPGLGGLPSRMYHRLFGNPWNPQDAVKYGGHPEFIVNPQDAVKDFSHLNQVGAPKGNPSADRGIQPNAIQELCKAKQDQEGGSRSGSKAPSRSVDLESEGFGRPASVRSHIRSPQTLSGAVSAASSRRPSISSQR